MQKNYSIAFYKLCNKKNGPNGKGNVHIPDYSTRIDKIEENVVTKTS